MTNKNTFWTNTDIGLLIVRFSLGGIVLFHGVNKLRHGVEEVSQIMASGGMPLSSQLAYLVYISEVLAPVLIVLGVFTRLSALSLFVTMIVIFLVLPFPVGLDEHGALNIESHIFFLLLSAALFFSGPGRYAVKKNNSGNWLLD